jgi:protein SCO1/2
LTAPFRWALWACVALLGVAVGLLIALVTTTHGSRSTGIDAIPVGPAATWTAGAKVAPGFSLVDQNGKSVSLAAYRGRPVMVTFIDPLCRDYCPLEARVLSDAVSALPAAQRPVIVAVSVNRWGNARSNLVEDIRKWQLPSVWRWGIGSAAQLGAVWAAYKIEVLAQTRTIAGVTVHRITHTEGSFVIDSSGHQRALFLWPYRAIDVTKMLRQLAASPT